MMYALLLLSVSLPPSPCLSVVMLLQCTIVDMPDMVRAYLNGFVGMHTILCTRGPQASQLITPPVIKDLATPSFHLFAMDTDARGEVNNITDYTGKKSRFASGRDDVPSTKSFGGMYACMYMYRNGMAATMRYDGPNYVHLMFNCLVLCFVLSFCMCVLCDILYIIDHL